MLILGNIATQSGDGPVTRSETYPAGTIAPLRQPFESSGHRHPCDHGLHLAAPSGVNPEPRSRLPAQLVTVVALPDVSTRRDRARSGVDAVRRRRDDLRPAGMTRFVHNPAHRHVAGGP
jgi:hypothetical protein